MRGLAGYSLISLASNGFRQSRIALGLLIQDLPVPFDCVAEGGCATVSDDEIPPHEAENTLRLLGLLANCGDLLSRGDVPAWLPTRIFVEAEAIPAGSAPWP
jgi:hypothetical protein